MKWYDHTRQHRTLKQKHIYLLPASNGWELYEGIASFVGRYNRCRHQGIDRQRPADPYPHQEDNHGREEQIHQAV